MMFYLSGLNPFFLFFLLFSVIFSFSVIGLFIVHKFFHSNIKYRNWNGARYITSFFTIIGALLGVILGMVLVTVWQNYQKEVDNVNLEAVNLLMIYTASYNLEQDAGDKIRTTLKQIIKEVIDDSWPNMKNGIEGEKVTASADVLYRYAANFNPKNSYQESIGVLMIKSLEKAAELRKVRNMRVEKSMIPGIMWIVIAFCIIVSITCGFFFKINPMALHVMLACLHSIMLSVVLFLIISMMYPYRGSTSISPYPFEKLLYKNIPALDKSVMGKKIN